MKGHRILIGILAWLFLLASGLAGAENNGSVAGVVEAVEGSAWAYADPGAKRLLDLESPVLRFETVETGPEGSVRLAFLDETTLELSENTRVELDEFLYDPGDQTQQKCSMRFLGGVFRFATGEIVKQNPDNFLVETPLSTLGIRGTTVASEVGPEGETHALIEGTPIEVRDRLGNRRIIRRLQFAVNLRRGEPATEPAQLAPEQIERFKKRVFARKITLERRRELIRAIIKKRRALYRQRAKERLERRKEPLK